MLWWVKRGLGFMLRFFFRSFTRAMGCFFACFRIRDNRPLPKHHLISTSSRSTDGLISRNRLFSLLSEEREESAGNDGVGSQGGDQGLKDEAKFLKACGTLAGTPAEIRKASEKLKVSPSRGKDTDPPKFHSWLPNTSVEKLQLDVQQFHPPTPIKLCQEWENSTDSFEHTPTSCISNAEDTPHDSLDIEGSRTGTLHAADSTDNNAASVSPRPVTTTQRKNKSVRFECDTGSSSCGSSSEQSAYKPSPYPTPLKLFDEMQTPGTVYPVSSEELPNGRPRVRSQFVYPIYNPGENVVLCKILEEKVFNPEQDTSELSDSVEQAQNASPTPEKGLKNISNENGCEVEASLSSWLKPVAAHWNGVEDSHISPPKVWDGNGIPNSTTKYKEDQKVKWHATPFEERLDKALSEENFIPQRKLVCGKPVEFDDIEESDTASSQLQPSSHPQSVVSF
ncbi:protein JASON [Gastrolobium bilobum]|uniref:protein JASON n=1 Tax=Gastrolobium bilobum TaxID=150636 RepID=UPI002AAF48A5|nr:protein JASON [Gastrolobium bilobum]